ncbi:MAG: MFS transporter [Eubacterium sp.]
MAAETIKEKVVGLLNNVRYYWKKPPKGRYMSFKEIASYAFGGIGAYLIVCMGYTFLLGSTNVFITGTIGIGPTDMYIMYVIAVLSGIPLTAVRANIVDNTRNKAGKYRPYILRMGIPSVLLYFGMVWFPYDRLADVVGSGVVFGKPAAYIAKCVVVLIFNILLQFFYYFFYDAYENLIHVLSPNSQERADVVSIKSIVYSLGPSVVNLLMPIIAQNIYHTNQTDIRVYRLLYPILSVIGVGLLILVYVNTQEKIIQAKTHVIQIKFLDAIRAVAKNKYFWIIALAGWIGFLETAYSNILYWLYNYGGACSGNVYSIIITLNGNSALWGMILAPFFIRKWGKKNVKIFVNLLNILFIIMMLPFVSAGVDSTGNLKSYIIWCVLACLYFNGVIGAFEHILNPSIQADIRDYQQYKTGERIDGAFSAVTAIGNVITLVTAGILPALQEKYGMTAANAKSVTSNADIMSRILPGNEQSIGAMLAEQTANGQDLFNPSNALYDVQGTLVPLLRILVIVAAIGATMNVIPYFFYDFTEEKQKSIVRILKIRAMFEDYGNNALSDHELVEAIDIVNNAKEMAVATPKELDKQAIKNAATKEEKKLAKKQYREALEYNEEIGISKFVVAELSKFDSELGKNQIDAYTKIYEAGLDGIKNTSLDEAKAALREAKAMPATTEDEKEIRKFYIELAKINISAVKSYQKFYGEVNEFKDLGFETIEKLFNQEDALDEKIEELAKLSHVADKNKDKAESKRLKAEIKKLSNERKEVRKQSKLEMDKHAQFNRAAKPYVEAKKLLTQQENFSHFDKIVALYDTAKENAAIADQKEAEQEAKRLQEEKEELERRKAEKAAKKAEKKNK